jgi:glycyl-tRNA synthetase beta chain
VSEALLFEIGTEEIPSAPLYRAIEQLRRAVPEALASARLSHGTVHVSGSPRRLAVVVEDLADRQPDLQETVKGPPARAAFDDDGRPTKAATGFAAKHGIDVTALERREEGGQEYVYAVVHEAGRPSTDVLPGLLARVAGDIDWPKSMRWGSGSTRFARPVRWLVCLLGSAVVDVEYAGLRAGSVSQGHRFLADGPIEIAEARAYGKALAAGKVIVDASERAAVVRQGIEAAAARSNGSAVVHDKTFEEVVNLVEWPTVAVGTFDEGFLRVPREVLETAMESHQRYFPVEGTDGELLPQFVVVHNGSPRLTERIVEGHERVIRARLADAAFFFDEDLKRPLEEHVHRLESIVFQERLGTVAARVERVETLAKALAEQVGASPDDAAYAVRAAHLAKADLVTSMVVEFPTLQGVMGRYYALASGETPEVADAILEHYRPRFAGDELPSTLAGKLVSLADKLDTIVGIFGAGMPPTGSADPYALRRSAIGVLNIVIESGLPVRLDEAIGAALEGLADALPDMDAPAVGSDVREFVLGRMETVLKERGHAYDTIAAVLAVAGDDPADAAARARALTAARKTREIEDVSVGYSRAKNLADPGLGTGVDESFLGEDERVLFDALGDAAVTVDEALSSADYDAALAALSSLRGPIDAFFENVLVMDEEPALRENRLKLLNRLVGLFSRFADLSCLVE